MKLLLGNLQSFTTPMQSVREIAIFRNRENSGMQWRNYILEPKFYLVLDTHDACSGPTTTADCVGGRAEGTRIFEESQS